jgi:hypothetical protein
MSEPLYQEPLHPTRLEIWIDSHRWWLQIPSRLIYTVVMVYFLLWVALAYNAAHLLVSSLFGRTFERLMEVNFSALLLKAFAALILVGFIMNLVSRAKRPRSSDLITS